MVCVRSVHENQLLCSAARVFKHHANPHTTHTHVYNNNTGHTRCVAVRVYVLYVPAPRRVAQLHARAKVNAWGILHEHVYVV